MTEGRYNALMRWLCVACWAVSAVACSDRSSEPSEPAAPRAAAAPAPAQPPTVLEGVVHLAPGAELALYPQNPVQVEGRVAIPATCTPPSEADREPVHRSADGGLNGVLVAL